MNNGFKRPSKRELYKRFLFIDGNDAVNSLAGIEEGSIESVLSKFAHENSKGREGEGTLGYGPVKVRGKGGKNNLQKYEEEVLRKRTEHAAISLLLDKLRGNDEIGVIEEYTPKVYEQVEENELYEFKAEIRLHPLHQLVTVMQGWAETGENFGADKKQFRELLQLAERMERAFHGKNKANKTLVIFAEIEGSSPEYRVAMPIKTSDLRVPLDEFTGRATFVAQVERKVGAGEKILAARIVRNSPVLPVERDAMLQMLPLFQGSSGGMDIGITLAEEDVVLEKPAVMMKPLCIYKG